MPVKRKSVSYDEARRIVRKFSLGFRNGRFIRITSHHGWRAFLKRHPQATGIFGVPNRPDVRYQKDGTWRSWQHFLSQREKRQPELKDFVDYSEWLDWIRKQPIKSKAEYERWCRENPAERRGLGFPSNPSLTYKRWKGWRDVFQKSPDSAGRSKGDYAPFETVRRIVRAIAKKENVQSMRDFQRWCRDNPKRVATHRIPLSPDRAYTDHWHGWADFLGTDRRPTPNRKRD